MQTIGIVGAGTMGRGIAHVAALAGFDVILNDLADDVLRNARDLIAIELKKGVEKGKLSSSRANQVLEKIRFHPSTDHLASAEIIIEAVVEKLEVKHNLLKKLEPIFTSSTIFASNTSSLSITSIASQLAHPERVVGMHFFNPPHIMKLVEVVRGHRTSDAVLGQTVDLVSSFGKTPVITKDTPGFIVNRIARPFYGEALRLLGEGVASVEDIDRIVRQEGGFAMGPFELMDLIGIDVNFAVTQSMFEQTFGEARYRPHIIQQQMVHAGLLGRKTKRGFYSYPS